jgi:hypothetical protein
MNHLRWQLVVTIAGIALVTAEVLAWIDSSGLW